MIIHKLSTIHTVSTVDSVDNSKKILKLCTEKVFFYAISCG